MKVRMLVQISGTGPDGRVWPPRGDTATVPDAEGVDLIKGGLAEAVKDAAPVEAATAPADDVETADAPPEPVKRGPGRPRKNPVQE